MEVLSQNKEQTQFESSDFQILSTPDAFRILSCGLYANKTAAVIRELSTNAVDSHAVAGTLDRPFEVHIPTYSNKLFKIRDYGTGLSHADIMGDKEKGIPGIYRCYFGTNKKGNLDVTGTLGLGSKSPLCLTESFTIASYQKGKKRSYVIEYSDGGLPQINQINHEEDTPEPDGFEVTVPVKQSDIWDFDREAREVFKYFTLKPLIKGSSSIGKDDLDYEILEKGSCWELTNSGKFRVVMGNVCYPVNQEKLGRYLSIGDNFVLAIPVIIHLKNKEVDIVPSRESLAYTRTTVDVLRRYIDIIHKEIADKIQVAVDACANIVEARCKLIELTRHYKIGNLELLYKNKKINCRSTYDFPPEITVQKVYWGYGRGRHGTEKALVKSALDINYTHKAVVVEKDVEKGHIRALCEYVEQNPKENVYLLDFGDDATVADTFRKKVTEELGLDDLPKFTDKFAILPAKKTTRYVSKIGNATLWNYTTYRAYDQKTDVPVDLDKESGVYTSYVNKDVKLTISGENGFTKTFSDLHTVKCLLNKIRDASQTAVTIPNSVYLVNSWHLKKFIGHKNWTPLSSLIEKFLTTYSEKAFPSIELTDFHNLNFLRLWKFLAEATKKHKIDDADINLLMRECHKDYELNVKLTEIRDWLGIAQTKILKGIDNVETQTLKKYPLLAETFHNNSYRHVIDGKETLRHLLWYLNSYNKDPENF